MANNNKILVFSVGYYTNKLDANCIIATNIAKELEKKEGITCILLTYSYTEEKKKSVFYNDKEITVLPINSKKTILKRKHSSIFSEKKIHYLKHPFLCLKYMLLSIYDFKEIYKYINNIQKNGKRYLISFISPFAICNRMIKYNNEFYNIVYQLDPWGYHEIINSPKKTKRIRDELFIFNKSSYIFTTDILYNTYKNDNQYKQYLYKMDYLNHPNLIKKELNSKIKFDYIDSNTYNIVFLGTLEDSYRNPSYFLKTIWEIVCQFNIKIKVYFIGKIKSKVIEKYQTDHPGLVIVKDSISLEESNALMNKNDIYLLNIGNTLTYQTPSKIIDYISTGNPVINIVKNKNDYCIQLIEKYKLGINVFEYESSSRMIYDFLIRTRKKRIPFSDIISAYYQYSPEYNANKLLRIIDKIE